MDKVSKVNVRSPSLFQVVQYDSVQHSVVWYDAPISWLFIPEDVKR